MSDYKITIKNVDECPLSLELDDNRYACDWMEDGFCHGLGQPGCPFQPIQDPCVDCEHQEVCPAKANVTQCIHAGDKKMSDKITYTFKAYPHQIDVLKKMLADTEKLRPFTPYLIREALAAFDPQPIQEESCETCKFDKECNHNVTTKSHWSIFWSKRLTHCSAYTPEVK